MWVSHLWEELQHRSGLMVAWLLRGEGRTQGSCLAQLWSGFPTGELELGDSSSQHGCSLPADREGGSGTHWAQLLLGSSTRRNLGMLTHACCSLVPAHGRGAKMAHLAKLWLGYLQQWVGHRGLTQPCYSMCGQQHTLQCSMLEKGHQKWCQ